MHKGLSIEALFSGAVTVGERGQVVIPAEARRDLEIDVGDKLLVFRHPEGFGIMLVKLEALSKFMREAMESLTRLERKVEEESGKEE